MNLSPREAALIKQWLRKNQARPAIVKEQKVREKFHEYALFLNSDLPIVQV